MTDPDLELQRAVGRIEGQQKQILEKLDAMIVNHISHERDDKKNFADIREIVDRRLRDQDVQREKQFAGISGDVSELKDEASRAKGAGWVILGLLASLATFVGGAVIAAINGHIKIH